MNGQILAHFGLTPADLLGSGGEAYVYTLDRARVVRIYKQPIARAYIEARHRFYAQLATHDLPFATPQIYASGDMDGYLYVIEQRMPGQNFAHVLPTLTGQARRRALTSYLHIAAQIGTIRFPHLPFGEFLAPEKPVQRGTWRAFLWERMQQALRSSRPDVQADVPDLDRIMNFLHADLVQVADVSEKCLVHGDYFPSNVFIAEDQTICGVGDFGYTSVIGDPRMDIAGAVVYLEVVAGYRPEDTQFLTQQAVKCYDSAIVNVIDLYRRYYSIYFSVCKRSDPPTYDWCIQNLCRAHHA